MKMLPQLPNAKTCPRDIAKKFSVEWVWYDTPLAFHQPWIGDKSPEQNIQVMRWCKYFLSHSLFILVFFIITHIRSFSIFY